VASYRDGRLRLDSLYLALGESGDEVFVGGRVELGPEPVLHLNVQADFAADWLRPWLGEVGDLDVGGRVALLAGLSGPLEQAAWSGQGEWTDGRFIPPSLPQTLEQARALVLLYPGFVVLDELTAELGGGAVTAAGRVDFRPTGVHYRFEAAARGVSLRWPPGWQLRGDADLTLASTAAGRQLAGQVTLDRAYYVQDIELSPAQLVQRLLTRSRLVVPETDEALASTALNVGVIAPGTVRVRNNLAELDATAELAVRGSLARPVVFGEVRTAAGGEVDYGGNTYTVERAVLTFANPARIDPYLDLVATTRVADYAVTLNIGGALSRPQTSFRSDPPLPDLEVLGLITTGAPIEQPIFTDVAGTATSTSASGAAEALLYGQAASLVSTRVGRLFGFDRVRVEPLTTGDTVAEARVTVGKRLSSGLFVTYSYDPASTAQDVIQVEWQLSDRLQLVLTQNGDESYAVDARWEKRF
jgi:translocation and assembly module TamB